MVLGLVCQMLWKEAARRTTNHKQAYQPCQCNLVLAGHS